jgi:hypothetical protein
VNENQFGRTKATVSSFSKLTTISAISKHLTFGQLYADPSSNPLGTTEEEARESYRVVYSAWRIDDSPSTVEALEDEILADFISPIEAITIVVAEEGTKKGRLKVTHCYKRYPGQPGKSRRNTFHERYWERVADEILLLLTSTNDEDFLPAFYQNLGGKSKGESERDLLQREVDQCAEVFDVPTSGSLPPRL